MTKSTLIKVLNENNVIFMGICQDNFYWVFGNFAKVLARFTHYLYAFLNTSRTDFMQYFMSFLLIA